MFNKRIYSLSMKLNKNSYLKSFSIIIFAFLITGLFSVVPFLLKGIFKNIRYDNIYTIALLFLLSIFTLAVFMFYSSISMGQRAWYSGRLRKKKQCFKRMVFWYKPKYSFKAFNLLIVLLLIKAFWTILFISPALITISTAILLAFTGGVEVYLFVSLLGGGAVLLITGLLFNFIIVQKYFLAPYLLVENPKLGILQVIKQSKNILEGHLFKVVRFKLSFMPFLLLYPLIIPIIFLHPHYKQSCCIIAKDLRL